MTITHLRLQNWKNFGKADVALRERIFMIGPDARGKSSYLDAMRFLGAVARDGAPV